MLNQSGAGSASRYAWISATVQFTVVGAHIWTVAFPAVHVGFASPTVYKSVVL
jgi:hypothetical protein